MSLLNDGTKLVFLHIPKTAGTTLHNTLAKLFDKDKICPERFRGLGRYTPDELDQFQFFSGHFTYSMIEKIPGKKFVFTCLRNPKDRIVSLYYFWRRHHESFVELRHLNGPRVAKSAKNLADFLSMDTPVPRNAIKNEICRVLAGNISTDIGNKYFEIKQKQKNYISKFEILQKSISTLSKLQYIMFVDSLDEDMEMLCEMLGIEYPGQLPKMNAKTETHPHLDVLVEEILTESHINMLRSLTDLDGVVYQIARIKRSDIISDIKNK